VWAAASYWSREASLCSVIAHVTVNEVNQSNAYGCAYRGFIDEQSISRLRDSLDPSPLSLCSLSLFR